MGLPHMFCGGRFFLSEQKLKTSHLRQFGVIFMDSPPKGGGAYFLANTISKFALDGLHEKQE